MPSTDKTLHFTSSALATSVSIGLIGYGMSTEWAKTTMDCASNGTATIILNLFDGIIKKSCPLFGGQAKFQVIPALADGETAPVVLHGLVLCLLVLCLLFSACSILISLYNSVSNPYETYLGPVGVYICSSLSVCLSVLVLILFVVNISVTNMAEALAEKFTENLSPSDLRNKVTVMQPGYYLVIPYTVLALIAIALIYAYDHAAYTRKKEQQKPTEDAPVDLTMY
ncbi:LOW QUALITY PROTEIN: clarin-3 [Archocentrus centrarchus]|uniref:LOW QUALITY PROTEIN: clarin-3 n=1 Tax=Archocentrus centrarchus TaxID=63155 RepID=UPI0011E9BBE8|nr:LOW QUALITY PROTEIN: clarin-3 [Archocentrus centrarchus]